MAIDWLATGAMLQGLGAFASAGAIVCAACIGKSSFERWRKQRVFIRKKEVAERVLAAAYEAAEALIRVRRHEFSEDEIEIAEDQLRNNAQYATASEEIRDRMRLGNILINRIKVEDKNFINLFKIKAETFTILGKDCHNEIEKILVYKNELKQNIKKYKVNYSDDINYIENLKRKIYNIDIENDKIEYISIVLNMMEGYVRKQIR